MNPHNPLDWYTKAERDWGLASHAQKHTPEYPDLICYHCQQAAEKYLKSLVIHHGLPMRKTHDLEELLDLLSPVETIIDIDFYKNARIVNDYGVQIRYPDPAGDPSEGDVKEAILAATFFREFTKKVLTIV
jgi:HEPN domain-containing protein